ncbi:MAG: agglutinin biogenesis protein [Sideroxydans sp.]|nr:agglutinin biogenesis protein [Sideroxydans sp.]
MKERWEALVAKVDGMSLRERALIFAALAFAAVSLINSFLLDPLLAQQKSLSEQVRQQQEKMKENQAQFGALLQAKQADEKAPERARIRQLREQLAQGDAYLKEKQGRLVPPEKMALLLEQVLSKNTRLQLVALDTLPASLFIEPTADGVKAAVMDKQIYKHGVKITVRGSYADLLLYLTALEKLPTQMFWGMAKMNVVKYPDAELTLTLYTLSLDKIWLQV